MKNQYCYPSYNATERYIICWNDSSLRNFRHEMGHAKQKEEFKEDYWNIPVILIEHQNILKNENSGETLLRTAYSNFYEFNRETPDLEPKKVEAEEAIRKKIRERGISPKSLELYADIYGLYGAIKAVELPDKPTIGTAESAGLSPLEVPLHYLSQTKEGDAADEKLARKLQYNFCLDVIAKVR